MVSEGSLREFAVAVFEIDAMIASSLIDGQSASKVDLCIFDLDAEHVERELLFRSVDGVGTVSDAEADYNKLFKMPGRHWQVKMNLTQAYYAEGGQTQTWILLGGGLLFSGLVGCFLITLAGSTARTERLVDERTEALQLTNVQLAQSNENLQEFAHVASHDLREPLRTVTSFLELLEAEYSEKLDGEAHKYIQFCVDGAARMKQLITALLEFSRVGSQQQAFEMSPVNEIVDDVIQALAIQQEETGTEIVRDELPEIVCDAVLLKQLFQNLIGNAMKYRSEQPKIHIFSRREKGDWVFAVQDNGPGISEQHFERVFQIFQRLHPGADVDGTGIGLAICKRIVERHRGRIWLESTKGEGSTFYFSIPVDISAADTRTGLTVQDLE